MAEIIEIMQNVGNFISEKITGKILSTINDAGIITNSLTAKIVSLIIILSLIYISIKFLNSISKPIKWAIIFLLISFFVSIIITFNI